MSGAAPVEESGDEQDKPSSVEDSKQISTKASIQIPALLCPDAVPGLLYNRATDCKVPMYVCSPHELEKRIRIIPNEKVSVEVFTNETQQVW